MTKKRMTFLKELLPFMGLGGRLRLEWISSAEAQKFVKVVTEFTEQIRNLGPDPLAKNYGDSLESLDLAPTLSEAATSGCVCSCSKAAAGA
jgi:hypothetical protein